MQFFGLANPSKILSQKQKLILLLLLGLIHGLIYVFVTPPWWHHDEPGHFQVAWFIANHDRRQEWGEYDEEMKSELIKSIDDANLFDYINYSPDSDANIPGWVLAPQAKDPPLYYAIASLPLRLLKNTNLALQNRVLRLLSLSFFLLILWISWELGGELFGAKHPLRVMGTAFLALLPGFVNEMTAISNEPPVTLFFAFFLLAGVRLLRRGFSWRNFILLSASAIAGYYTKNTVWISLGLLTALVLLFMPFRKHLKWFPWVVILFAIFAFFVFVFQWGDARYWYNPVRIPADTYTRQFDENAPLGDYILQVSYKDTLRQRIPVEVLKPLRSRTLTLGFWAWASEAVSITAPRVTFTSSENFTSSPPQTIELNSKPTFYSFAIEVPSNSGRGWLDIRPATGEEINPDIYFDGIVLAEGKRGTEPPEFTDNSATLGNWHNFMFTNLIRNASYEEAWLRLSPKAWDKGLKKFYPYLSTLTLAALQDWQGSGWYFKRTFIVLNETFWGRFGPSTVSMLGSPYIYRFLRGMILFGLLGFFALIWKNFKSLNKRILLFLSLSILVIWGQTLLRGAITLDAKIQTIPWTRYALPAILPTVMVLCAGWFIIINNLIKRLGIHNDSLLRSIFIAFMLSLDFLAILTMLQFFYLQTQWTYLAFFIALFLSLVFLLTGKFQNLTTENT